MEGVGGFGRGLVVGVGGVGWNWWIWDVVGGGWSGYVYLVGGRWGGCWSGWWDWIGVGVGYGGLVFLWGEGVGWGWVCVFNCF